MKKYPLIKEQLERFEEYLLHLLQVRQPLIKDAANDLVLAGGKRLRPTLVITAGQFSNTPLKKLLPIAAAVELMHMATLVHDDIIDEALLRRGRVTTQSRFGKDVAVFTGDYLFSLAFSILSGEADVELLKRLARAVKYICEGEIDQYQNRYNMDISFRQYFRRIRRKTAILYQASCFSGSFQGKLDNRLKYTLSKYGKYFGMIFQITDDILDITGNEKIIGKPIGNDFSQGVYTLPIVFALQDPTARVKLKPILESEKIDQDLVLRTIKDTKAIDQTKNVIKIYEKKALDVIHKLPSIKARFFLADLLKYVVDRTY